MKKLMKVTATQRLAQLHAEAMEHAKRGTCPRCGTKLIRNLALAGWWQCGAYASPSHRRPEYLGLAQCSFQCFTK